MGIFQWFRSAVSTRDTLLAELAEIAGGKEFLIERLKRHAAMCQYANIKAGLEQLAVKEGAHFKQLKLILADNDLWPRPPQPPSHEGSNNWERLTGDLELASELSHKINRQAVLWEPVEAEISRCFEEMYAEDYDQVSFLRDLALKCDPQALD